MAAFAEGAPCWVDASLPDVEAGKRFYGELFGWTFADGAGAEYGHYTQAYSRGRNVAALAPKPDGRMPTVWGVYLYTTDAYACAQRIRAAGGQMVMDPMPVGPYGTAALAADPGGAVFGLWQPGTHHGFEAQQEPYTYCWTEVYTRARDAVDVFYAKVFGYVPQDQDDSGESEYRLWSPPGSAPARPAPYWAAASSPTPSPPSCPRTSSPTSPSRTATSPSPWSSASAAGSPRTPSTPRTGGSRSSRTTRGRSSACCRRHGPDRGRRPSPAAAGAARAAPYRAPCANPRPCPGPERARA